jgi:Fur family zinc uptake transcriptional regulator
LGTTEEIMQRMSREGLRITEQRKTMVHLFDDAAGYLTPKEVYEHMHRVYPGLSFDTVYRNLRLLADMNIVEQIMFEDGIKFKMSCEELHHHHHMICLQCQRTTPIRFCPMSETDVPGDFEVVMHKFEVFGYCGSCKVASNDVAAASERQ